jgi:CBS domain-containing protein
MATAGRPLARTTDVKHPILRLDVLAADGTVSTDHVVFCRLQDQSVRVEECCRCVRCTSIEEGMTPAVSCTLPHTPLEPADDPRGERIEVGSTLSEGTMVFSEAVSIGRALEVMRDRDRRCVAIVDERHRIVGLVHEAHSATRTPRAELGEVRAAMTSPIAIDERTPVRTALKLLAAHHLREATVVSKRRVPVGMFRDIDGLRWLAAARRGAAPST